MRVEWYGQSAFRLSTAELAVAIDPFGDISALKSRGLQFDYPPIATQADLLLITHEHADHAGVECVGGDPAILRSTAGTLSSPLGEVTAIASEHDDQAGTARGPNTIYAFELDGLRICHLGDFGQRGLREEQAAAIGKPDLLFLPVGGSPTIDAQQALAVIDRLAPRWAVPMHYRTPRLGFLETADQFLDRAGQVHRLSDTAFETTELPRTERPLVVVPASP